MWLVLDPAWPGHIGPSPAQLGGSARGIFSGSCDLGLPDSTSPLSYYPSHCTPLTAALSCAQEVEYVKEEAKMVYLLECLQKTPPPVSTAHRLRAAQRGDGL